VKRAKNDPYGTGRIAHLTARTVALVDEWTSLTGIDRGPLLRPVYRDHAIPRYRNPAAVARTLKKLADHAGFDAIETPADFRPFVEGGGGAAIDLERGSAGGGARSMSGRYIEDVEMQCGVRLVRNYTPIVVNSRCGAQVYRQAAQHLSY